MKNRFSLAGANGLVLMLMTVLAISSCKRSFDEPFYNPPTVTTNATIAQLKSTAVSSGQFVEITNDIVFRAIVTANDKSGNIYKQLYVQDSTGAIALEVDATGLFNQYPVGREVFIKAKGLYLVNESGMVKLALRGMVGGTPSVIGIPTTLIERYIIPGTINHQNEIEPKVVTIAELNNNNTYQSLLSTLVKINDVEITPGELNNTYSDTSANKLTQNRNIKDCSGASIIMRTSGFANFAGVRLPQGKGSVTGIFTVFASGSRADRQLLVRDTSDLQMYGPRCGAANPNLVIKSIQEIRNMYTTGPATIPANTGIKGIIVSNTANEAAGNYRIQEPGGAGIQIRFANAGVNPNAVVGDEYIVDISGLPLDLFPAGNGDLQVNNVLSATKTGTGTVVPRETTVAAIKANVAGTVANSWASTLVKLSNVTITPGAPASTGINYDVTDATGTISTFIRTTLGFTPPAAATSLVGYVSIFGGTPQITLRSPADVVAGTITIPTVTTTAASGITQTAATTGGNVSAAGTSAVTARGVVWSTSPAPTVALTTKTTDGSGTGAFTSNITGLTAGTTYYARAYATNASGTAYGSEISFTTQNTSGGTVITESFEIGAKTSYAAASVALSSGSWMFSDAILGNAASDIKNGAMAARIRGTVGSNNGFIETEFAITGLKKITLSHAQTTFFEGTGTLTPSFEVQVSRNGGAFTKVGNTVTPALGTLGTATFDVNAAAGESVKVRILNTSGASIQTPTNQVRINIDDVKFEQ